MSFVSFITNICWILSVILIIISAFRMDIPLFALALILFFTGLIIFTLSPEYKAMEEAERIAKEKFLEEINKNLQLLSEDSNNTQALEFLLSKLESFKPPSFIEFIPIVALPLLQLKPLDERTRTMVFSGFLMSVKRDTYSSPSPSNLAQSFYNTALHILALHPEELSLKQYVLNVGRWYYSILRPDGKITIYDEQAIQNDIIVRTR
jgi:hypothetical protein